MRILSYNILAPSYARPERYPFTEPWLLAWEARRDRLAARLLMADADVLCLQEVEGYIFRYLRERLEPGDFEGIYARKGHNRSDGCATFYRTSAGDSARAFLDSKVLRYSDGDGEPDSGHFALTTRFRWEGQTLSVTNTHIRWDEPDARGRGHVGYREVSELLETVFADGLEPVALCGDFNATPDRDLIQLALSRGFSDAYAAAPQPTANSDRTAKRIDYIFHSSACRSQPEPLPMIDDETPLPSETEPSDHLPILATLTAA